MIAPTTSALASSAVCIATTSSWWALARHAQVTAESARLNPNPCNTTSVSEMTPVTRANAAPHRDARQALIASGIFGKSDPDAVSALAEHARLVYFPPKYEVFAQGEPGSWLYVIAAGRVKVVHRHADGREAMIDIVGAPEVFGEVSPFDGGIREFTATTVTDVCAVVIERDQLLAWIVECPQIIHQLLRLFARRADAMTNCAADFVFADPSYRIARRLLLLGKRFGKREGEVVRVLHDLTVEEISQFAGVASELVNATLCEFSDRGWIRIEAGCLEIVDGQGLSALPIRK
jgi:CRP/FNR family transcriptional regulator, cyclic AMP receptor protein